MKPHLANIYTHPIKGFAPVELPQSEVTPLGIPQDRMFAMLFLSGAYTQHTSGALPFTRKEFLSNQMQWPCFATLACKFAADFSSVTITAPEQAPIKIIFTDADSVAAGEKFLTEFIKNHKPSSAGKNTVHAPLKLVRRDDIGGFPDRAKYQLSILNNASLADLSATLQTPLDIRRFRGNLVVDGLPAWEEKNWVGKKIAIGSADIEIKAPIARCYNVNVDPKDGNTSVDVLNTLAHTQRGMFGVIANVVTPGLVKQGDEVRLLS